MTTNLAASVAARLANKARAANRPFQEMLQYYGLERFLYRLSTSRHRDRFVLKGALMLRVWDAPESRPTRDIDFLGYIDNDVATLEEVMREVCRQAAPPDGLDFDPTSVAGGRIKEDAEYQGVRVKLTGFLAKSRIPVQIDVGFGDVIHPVAEEKAFPTLLDLPAPMLRSYPRETVVAEKFPCDGLSRDAEQSHEGLLRRLVARENVRL